MTIHETDLPGVLRLEPRVFRDARGAFRETWHAERYAEAGLPTLVQVNASRSAAGVLRGLHFQHPQAQGKLVGVLEGEVLDVAVDIRRGSPTFGRSVAAVLSEENGLQFYIPPGFAHGFAVTSPEGALVLYGCTALYSPADEVTIRWDDPALGIAWPVAAPLLAPRDAAAPCLAEIPVERLPVWEDPHG